MNQFKRAMITVMFAVCMSKGVVTSLPATAATQAPLLLTGSTVQTVDESRSEND